MVLRTRNKMLLAKVESSEGEDALPSASDAILVSNLRWSPNPNVISTDEHTGSLDPDAPLVGGMTIGLTFDVFLKGSGTPGTAPEIGKLIRACGFAETVTGTAVPASAEACGAGGSTTTAELGSSASTTAQIYRGMPINFTEEVAGSSFITDYTTGKIATLTDTFAAIDADTDYQIPVNVLYKPTSDAAAIPSLTFYVYEDGTLTKLGGGRGNFDLNMTSGGEARLTFNFSCMLLEARSDASVPTSPGWQTTRPPLFKNAAIKLHRVATPIQALTLSTGNTVTNPDNPNKLEAFDPALVTARRLTGTINPTSVLVATRDAFADFRAGTQRILYARIGSTAGNRAAVVIPAAQYTNYGMGDRSGLATDELPFEATGRDAGAFLCFY